MLVDWFTVIAQVINFLILMVLLRRFLYRPILRAMGEREARIAATLEAAEATRAEATRKAERYREQNSELQERREEMLLEAREEAEAWRRTLIAEARDEIRELRARWYAGLQQEKEAFFQDLRQRTGRQIYAIARRALADLANTDLEQQAINVFIERLDALDEHRREAVVAAIRSAGGEVIVSSAFDVPPESRRRIRDVLQDQMAEGLKVRFETRADLICGVELRAQGYKIGWSLENYLESLEESLVEALAKEAEEQDERELHRVTSRPG